MHRLFFFALLFPAFAWAGPVVEFQSSAVMVDAKPEDKQATLEFKFKVSGDAPWKLADIEPGCKCLQASSAKAEYQPGEEGSIKAVMELTAFEGEFSKFFTVISNDSRQPSLALRAIVRIPPVMEFSPQVTTWQVNDPATAKKVTVKVLQKEPMQIHKVSSNSANVAASLTTITAGREYEILLTPTDTSKRAFGVITLETDSPLTKYARRTVFYNIVSNQITPGIPAQK